MRTWARRIVILGGGAVLLLLTIVTGWYWVKRSRAYPESHVSMVDGERIFRTAVFENHETEGVPYWIWKSLPEMFPEFVPPDYRTVGFVWEPGKDLPLGLNRSRRFGTEWVTHNCALCHAGSYRAAAGAEPAIVMGMPNVTFRRQVYVEALEKVFTSDRFTPDTVLAAVARHATLDESETAIYRHWIGRLRERTRQYLDQVGTTRDSHPRHPPGAAEGFGAAKQYASVFDTTIGTADFPSTWEQGKRVIGHWDGISTSTLERVIGSALAIGAQGSAIDMGQMLDLDSYTRRLAPPVYPFPVDADRARQGAEVFVGRCGGCHAGGGPRFNTIVPLGEIGTDPHRQQSLDSAFLWRIKLGTLPAPYPFQHWQSSNGYRSDLLEGVWLRGPYLHNGSVPTIRDLLSAQRDRPRTFWRGTNILDTTNMGFMSDRDSDGNTFLYDTSLPGYSNSGHEYGIDLTKAEKDALIEYMKTGGAS